MPGRRRGSRASPLRCAAAQRPEHELLARARRRARRASSAVVCGSERCGGPAAGASSGHQCGRERHVAVPSAERAAGGAPRVGDVGVAVGRRPRQRRVAEVLDHPVQRLHAVVAARVGPDPEDPHGRDHVLERPADLRADRGVERLRAEQLPQHRHDRGVVRQVDVRASCFDEPGCGSSRTNRATSLSAMRRAVERVMREVVRRSQPASSPVRARVLRRPAQHLHRAGVMALRVVVVRAASSQSMPKPVMTSVELCISSSS